MPAFQQGQAGKEDGDVTATLDGAGPDRVVERGSLHADHGSVDACKPGWVGRPGGSHIALDGIYRRLHGAPLAIAWQQSAAAQHGGGSAR